MRASAENRIGLPERHAFPLAQEKGFAALLNMLTAIRLRYYSGAMTPDMNSLADKIEQLATLTQDLRRENADLRLQLAAVIAEKAELDGRMQEACIRTAALLDKLPQPAESEEAA